MMDVVGISVDMSEGEVDAGMVAGVLLGSLDVALSVLTIDLRDVSVGVVLSELRVDPRDVTLDVVL